MKSFYRSISINLLFNGLFFIYFFLIESVLKGEPGWKILYLPRIYFQSLILINALHLFWVFGSIWVKGFYRVVTLLFVLVSAAYMLQYFFVYYTGVYAFPAALMQPEAINIWLTINNVAYVIIGTLGVIVIFYIVNQKIIKPLANRKAVVIHLFTTTLLLSSLLGIYKATQIYTKEMAIKLDRGTTDPLLALLGTIRMMTQSEALTMPIFTNEELIQIKALGLPIDTAARYPLFKTSISKDSIPFKKKKPITNKNVIIIYCESLSAAFVSSFNDTLPQLTPHIDQFSSQGTKFTNYINHCTPTVNGLLGQFNSYYATANANLWNNSRPNFAQFQGFPNILREHNYNTYLFSYEDKSASINLRQLFFEAGFEHVLLRDELSASNGFPYADYLSDEQMFDATINFLDNQPKEPFLLTTLTIETHLGTAVPEYYHKYDAVDNDLLHLFSNFDYHFGRFWEYFQNSAFFHNTTVILTADHSYFPTKEANDLFSRNNNQAFIDKIALIVYDPEYEMPAVVETTASALDFAPTLLHLLNIKEAPNSFAGLSIFGERKNYPEVFGREGGHITQLSTAGELINHPINQPKPRAAELFEKWLHYQNFLIQENRIFPNSTNP